MENTICLHYISLFKVLSTTLFKFCYSNPCYGCSQRWSRGHKARGQGQGHKKIRGQGQSFRGQTLSRPRTGMLAAKAKDQGHKRKCSPKKKKRSSQKFFRQSPKKKGLHKHFSSDLHKILTIQKIVLSSSRGQANFRGLEASRPRTSKCVLEDSTSGCSTRQSNVSRDLGFYAMTDQTS